MYGLALSSGTARIIVITRARDRAHCRHLRLQHITYTPGIWCQVWGGLYPPSNGAFIKHKLKQGLAHL